MDKTKLRDYFVDYLIQSNQLIYTVLELEKKVTSFENCDPAIAFNSSIRGDLNQCLIDLKDGVRALEPNVEKLQSTIKSVEAAITEKRDARDKEIEILDRERREKRRIAIAEEQKEKRKLKRQIKKEQTNKPAEIIHDDDVVGYDEFSGGQQTYVGLDR
jgi:hypothetical protein